MIKEYKIKKFFFGIQILRMILSFLIIVFHFNVSFPVNSQLMKIIGDNLDIYLSTFFFISFYFSYEIFITRNISKIKQRFLRLLIPYIIWPIIFFIYHNLKYCCFNQNTIQFKYLIYQLIVGNGVYIYFWFQYNLIFLSLLFIIIIFIFKSKYFLFLKLLSIFSYLFLCSVYYKNIYIYFNYIIAFPIGPLSKTYIYSFTGFYFSSKEILNKINQHIKKVILLFILFLFLIIYEKSQQINKPNIECILIVLCSIIIFYIFLMIQFEGLTNSKYIYFIKQITNYTGGIYYLHPKIINLFISKNVKNKNILMCIIIYILSYLICLIGYNTIRNYKLKYLFI